MPLTEFPNSPAPAQDSIQLPPYFPPIPDEILERFAEAQTWNDSISVWWKQLAGALSDSNDSVTAVVNANDQTLGTVVVQQGEMTAEIEVIQNTIINNYGVLSQRIVTVSALAGSSSHITVSGAPPGAPALNDLWVNTTNPATPVTSKWNGAAWIEVTVPISVAAVAAEQTARITADGFLSANYSITVVAGSVVTGMQLNSSSGGGTTSSTIDFQAANFRIWDGTATAYPIFSTAVGSVKLASTLTVNTSGKVFTGTGTYANNNTPFYVDSTSHFSLGANLTWDGTTLTITGSISATTGTIGGWNVSATTLSNNNAVLDSAGQLFLGTGNNIVYLSATDATYRLWIGNVTAGTATFSVTKAGALFCSSGTIAGFTITGSALDNGTIVLTGGLISISTAGYSVHIDNSNGVTLVAAVGTRMLAFSGPVDTNNRFEVSAGGVLRWGSGGGAVDTNLYRGSAGNLFTDTNFRASGSIQADSGFVGTTLTASGAVSAGGGSAGAPGHTFQGASNYGMYQSGSNLLFSTSGTLRGYFDTSYNFVVTNGTVNMLMSIDTGTTRGLIGTGTNHTLEVVTNSAVVWFFGADGHFKSNGGDIRKVASDSWTVKLYDGTNEIEMQASGGQIFGRINGGGAILLG